MRWSEHDRLLERAPHFPSYDGESKTGNEFFGLVVRQHHQDMINNTICVTVQYSKCQTERALRRTHTVTLETLIIKFIRCSSNKAKQFCEELAKKP